MRKNVFISYALEDTEWATWIAGALERNGFTVFVGEKDLLPGDDFLTKVSEVIRNVDVFMLVLSDAYTKSVYCNAEFGIAFSENSNKKLKFISARVSNTIIPTMMLSIKYVDLLNRFDAVEAEQRIIYALDECEIVRDISEYPKKSRFEETQYPGRLPDNNLPPRNRYFVGRDINIQKIFEELKNNSVVQIVGFAGIGKTQLAIEYAYRYGDSYSSAIWVISALDKSTVLDGFTEFCAKVGIKLSDSCSENELQKVIKKWLKNNTSWLIIVDDLIDFKIIDDYLPTNGSGHILITTRSQDFEMGVVFNIDVLSNEEAMKVLKLQLPNHRQKELRKLMSKLGNLPLALEQATSYICNKEVSVDEFIQRFDFVLDTVMENMNYFDRIMFASFQTLLLELSQSAKQLLYLASYMAPQEISFALYIRNRDLIIEPLRSSLGKEEGVAQLFDELSKFSLITGNQQKFSIHPYYQGYLRLIQDVSANWLDICLRIMIQDIPNEYDDWETTERFTQVSEHAKYIVNYAYSYFGKKELKRIEVLELYSKLGNGFCKVGKYDEALSAFVMAIKISDNLSDREYFDISTIFSSIARIYDLQGRYSEAIEYYKKSLAVIEKALGSEHPNIAQIYIKMATIKYHQRKFVEALELNTKALSIQKNRLGQNHPITASTIENIASIYYNLNELDKSFEWHSKALAIFESVLGTDHPDTANVLNNMGVILDDQGKYEKAISFYQRALVIFEKVFGKDNENTAQAYYNIAINYRNRGDYARALEWYKKSLPIFENIFGSSHPLTVTIKTNIKKLRNIEKVDSCVGKDGIPVKLNDPPIILSKSLPDAEIADLSVWYTSLDTEIKIGTDLEFRMFLTDLQASIKQIKEKSEFLVDSESALELCQYTKLGTLKFLVKAASEGNSIPVPKFRLSNVAYLNDPSEGEVFIDLLNYYVERPIFNESFGISTEKNAQSLTEMHMNDVYIGSFSTEKNKLPLWTLYGDNSSGCCVVFDNSFFTNSRSQDGLSTQKEFLQDIRLYKVNYYNTKDLSQTDDEIMRAIKSIATNLERWHGIVMQSPKLLKWISNRFDEVRFLFKSDDYLYEDEVRLILRDDRVNKPFIDRSSDVPKLFMNVNNPVVLKEVILGAKVENPSANAQFLLFTGVKKVTLSGITYR